jgi:hypothetical protein
MGTPTRSALPTREELAVWRAYIETFEILRGRVESTLHHDTGLSTGDYKVLLALSEADDHTLRSSSRSHGAARARASRAVR